MVFLCNFFLIFFQKFFFSTEVVVSVVSLRLFRKSILQEDNLKISPMAKKEFEVNSFHLFDTEKIF